MPMARGDARFDPSFVAALHQSPVLGCATTAIADALGDRLPVEVSAPQTRCIATALLGEWSELGSHVSGESAQLDG